MMVKNWTIRLKCDEQCKRHCMKDIQERVLQITNPVSEADGYGIGYSGGRFRTEHAVDEEDVAEIDKLLEVVGAVSITELGG
ncbi:hypothetical protein TNCV_4467091 [Trichonephila clavipes]|nr:hypothetical protein TNCV_4467091 [Trichonephila clavipes]